MKRERNCSRTIVTVIAKRSVTAAPNIRTIMNCVHRPDRVFDCVGRVRWRVCDSVSQHRAISWNHRTRTADIETGRSRFRIVFVAIVRLSGTNRSRRVIRDLNRLRLLRFPLERKRLKRHASVGRLRWINRFPIPPQLRVGINDEHETQCSCEQGNAKHGFPRSCFWAKAVAALCERRRRS